MLVNKLTPDLSGASGTGATPEPPRKDPPPTETTQDIFVATSDGLNLRKEQSSTSQVIVIVPLGTQAHRHRAGGGTGCEEHHLAAGANRRQSTGLDRGQDRQ